MLSKLLLKKVGVFTLIAFVFLIGTAEYSFASEEDILLKARKYYQQGNYDESVKVLQKFIENLRAIVEQKKNVAEAFYLLAKVYYTVGEDAEVENNLKKVYETFPSFSKEENDIEFKKKIDKIRKDMGLKKIHLQPAKKIEQKKPVKKVIQKEGKKKKKFPVLLVVGGVALIALLVILLSKKKTDKEELYDIRGRWTIRFNAFSENVIFRLNFSGGRENGTFIDLEGDTGTYHATRNSIIFEYDLYNISFSGNLENNDNMHGSYNADGTSGPFTGERGFIQAISSTNSSINNLKIKKRK